MNRLLQRHQHQKGGGALLAPGSVLSGAEDCQGRSGPSRRRSVQAEAEAGDPAQAQSPASPDKGN